MKAAAAFSLFAVLASAEEPYGPPAPSAHPTDATKCASRPTLALACQRKAEALCAAFGADHVWFEAPFVLAGDLPIRDAREWGLRSWHEKVIRPAATILWRDYFSTRPQEPIVVLLFGSLDAFRTHARARGEFARRHPTRYGFYEPSRRAVVVNVSTGTGTLLHELTHALMDCDFPDAPPWLCEGMATLHESRNARFVARTARPPGANRRGTTLRKALRRGQLPSLRRFLTMRDFRGPMEPVHYALARYFCAYIRSSRKLAELYRTFRDHNEHDRTGLSFVEEVFGRRRIELIEQDFLAWVRGLPEGDAEGIPPDGH